MATVSFSGTLLRFVNYQKTVVVEAITVRDMFGVLADTYPQVRSVLFDADGNVRKVHQIFLNGRQVLAEEYSSPIGQSDRVELMTAIAGG